VEQPDGSISHNDLNWAGRIYLLALRLRFPGRDALKIVQKVTQ
jgi:hypothetical protein